MKPGITRRGWLAAVAATVAAIPLVKKLWPEPKKRKIWIGHHWPMPARGRAKNKEPG